MKKISILGATYSIKEATQEEDPKLESAYGYCDTSSKEIVIEKPVIDELTIKNVDYFTSKTLRHEIIHAFLHESGLDHNSKDQWATNEEMIDWMAIQLPKIVYVLQQL